MALIIQSVCRSVDEYRLPPKAPVTQSTQAKFSAPGMRRIAFGRSPRLLAPLWRPFFFQNSNARKQKIKKLLRQLKTGSRKTRMKAALALGKMKAKEAVSNLMAAYKKETHWDVRKTIIQVLRDIGDYKAITTIVSAIEDKFEIVIREADFSLVMFGRVLLKHKYPKPTIKHYLSALNDKHMLVRYAAAEFLGHTKNNRKALEGLHRAALSDKSAAVRARAIMSLDALLQKSSAPTLTKCLKDGSTAVRLQAARTISSFSQNGVKITKAMQLLIAMAKNRKEHVLARYYATVSIGNMGDRKAVPILIKLLNSKSEEVVMGAAGVLGNFKDKQAVKPLIAALKHPNWKVRWNAVMSLSKFKDARSIKPLIALARNPSEVVGLRALTIGKLGVIGNRKAVPAIIKFLKSRVRDLPVASSMALCFVKDKRAVKPLIDALGHGNAEVRYYAAVGLGKQGDARAVKPLAKVAMSRFARVEVREAASKSLGQIGGHDAVRSLAKLAGSKVVHIEVRKAAIKSLRQIGGHKAVSALIKLLKTKLWIMVRHAAEYLGELKDKRAVKPLIATLKHKKWQVRYYAALSLGSLKDKRAIKPLLKLLDDKDPKVRQAASVALMQFNDKKIDKILRKKGYLY